MSVLNYIKMGKPVLKSTIQVTTLGISSGYFSYIKPNSQTGTFTGVLDSTNNWMTYQLENTDIDVQGVWKIWAVFIDSNGRTSRGDTTEVTFNNELM